MTEVFGRAGALVVCLFMVGAVLIGAATPSFAQTQTIASVPTSVTGFVGVVGPPDQLSAPIGKALFSINDFTSAYPTASPEMLNSARGFFMTGGAELTVFPAVSNAPADLIDAIGWAAIPVNGTLPVNILAVPALSALSGQDYLNVAVAMNAKAGPLPGVSILDLPQDVVVEAMATNDTSGVVALAESLRTSLPVPASAIAYSSALTSPDFGSIPAAGVMAGVFAQNDEAFGVWHPPAGQESVLPGFTAQWLPDDTAMGAMGPIGVNSFKYIPATGTTSPWGARDLGPEEDSNRYVNVVRFSQYISTSVTQGLKWAEFEPSGPKLWSQISTDVTEFMETLRVAGAFSDTGSSQPFFVVVNETNNPLPDIQAGIVHIDIAFKPPGTEEYVVLNLTVPAGRGM